MKLEVGMYVRSKINGTIGKITDIENIEVLNEKREVLISGEKRYILDNNYNRGFCDTEKDTVIASHNIIDLIEVGDYVNGYKVVDIKIFSDGNKYVVIATEEHQSFWKDKVFEEDIKSIVTKEQFESMSYKV